MLFGNKKRKAEYIVDVHCHIMPGVDDGARDMGETLKMLEIAESEGITHMIVTPHYKSGYHNASAEKVKTLMEDVMAAAKECGINMELFQGNEILYHDEMYQGIEEGRISRMNGTD
ncbi:MAG: CpsB/CapC family capsule biosynthesis tyrosine phosphatase, partial [Lachnospira sp.]|nr:CpsB/CapC family capsule biosynthesis tyrosine phosphatase [Lachnospira sp.]